MITIKLKNARNILEKSFKFVSETMIDKLKEIISLKKLINYTIPKLLCGIDDCWARISATTKIIQNSTQNKTVYFTENFFNYLTLTLYKRRAQHSSKKGIYSAAFRFSLIFFLNRSYARLSFNRSCARACLNGSCVRLCLNRSCARLCDIFCMVKGGKAKDR